MQIYSRIKYNNKRDRQIDNQTDRQTEYLTDIHIQTGKTDTKCRQSGCVLE